MFQRSSKRTDSQAPPSIDGFSEREAVDLFRAGRITKMMSGEYFERKETDDALLLVLDGELSMTTAGEGLDNISARVGKGSWLGNLNDVEGMKNIFLISSSQASRVLSIDRPALSLLSLETQLKVFQGIANTRTLLLEQAIANSRESSRKASVLGRYTKELHENGDEEYSGSALIQDMIKSFPRLPIQINKLTSMLLDEGASVSEIVGFAKMDPSIVSVVLKTVNSGYYSFQRKISDFHHAFVLLGFNQVYQILMENFLEGFMPKHFNLKELNLHSAIISQVAFDISLLSKKSKPVMMSTLGILHDLGNCVVLVSKAKKPELDVALTRLNSPKIGSMLLDSWNTPAIICRSVQYQAYPGFCPPEQIPEDCRESVAILHTAHLCYGYMSGRKKEDCMQAFSEEYMGMIGLSGYSVGDLVNQQILPSLTKKANAFPDYVKDFINNQPAAAAQQPVF